MNMINKIKAVYGWLMKDKKRLALLGAAIVVLIIILVVRGKKSAQPQYQTSQVTSGTIISSVSASGSIISSNTVNISTQATGIVKNVLVKDGDHVYAGQTMATLTLNSDSSQRSAQAYASYLSAKNSVAGANANLYSLQSAEFVANQKFINDAAARGLATDDPTYIEEYAQWKAAEANYINGQNSITQAQANLSNAWLSYQDLSPNITAPIAGVLDNITLTPGMVITGSTTSSGTNISQRIAVIRFMGNPIGSFNVSEIDITKIKPGQKATITLDSLPDKTFTGKVMSVDKIGTVSSGVTNYPVTITFDTSSSDVLPNMSASASIIITTKDNVLLVPSTAIQTQGTQTVIRLLDKNNQIQNVNVEIGLSSDTETEITSGVSEGQTVVTGTVSSTTSSQSSSIFSTLNRGSAGGAVRVNTGGR